MLYSSVQPFRVTSYADPGVGTKFYVSCERIRGLVRTHTQLPYTVFFASI